MPLSESGLFSSLTKLDWIVFFLIITLTFISVLYGHYIKTNPKDRNSLLEILVMGRRLTLPLFVVTLVSSWYGGIFGVTRIAFERGIYNFITQGFFWYLTYLIFALFMVDKILSYNVLTLPQMVGKLFGPKARMISGILNVINVIPISYVISIGLCLEALFNIPFIPSMFIGTGFAVIYCFFGGLRAEVFSDIVQFFVMLLAVFLVLYFSIDTYGGLSFLEAALPKTHFSFSGGENLLSVFAWGFIAVATLVDPTFYQRCFAAKSKKTAKYGIYISIVIWIAFDICTTAGGMYAKAVMPEESAASAYMTYALSLLPQGLRGFFLAGIVATILSTLDTYLVIASNTITYDLSPKWMSNKAWIHYLNMALVGLFAIFLGSIFDGNIRLVWKTLGSYFVACLLIPVLYAQFIAKSANDKNFIFAAIFGIVTLSLWPFLKNNFSWTQDIDSIYPGMLASGLGLFLSRLKS